MPQPKIPAHPHQHLRTALGHRGSTFTRLAKHAAQLIQDREQARQELQNLMAAETGGTIPTYGDHPEAAGPQTGP